MIIIKILCNFIVRIPSANIKKILLKLRDREGDIKKTPTNFAGVSVVIPPRFERGTYCLEGSCSIQLSYGTFYSLVGMTRLERATPWSQTKYSAN